MVSLWIAVPVVVYLLLVLLGVTQSSIGISGLREDPGSPTGVMIGTAQEIRSDEYLTSTPLAIGVTATGDAEDFNPLTADQGFATMFPSTFVSTIVLFDGAALRLGNVIPDQMLIAARWWLPFLLLFLGAPAFFREITGSRMMGLFAAVMIVVSPSAAWWSFGPLGVIGFTIAGAACLQHAAREFAVTRRPGRAVAWGLASAILLARSPLHYQPWAIVVVPTILLIAIAPLLMRTPHWKRDAVAVVAVGASSLVLAALVVVENLASIDAIRGTGYPGARVSSGSANSFQDLFGATNLGWLPGAHLVMSNPSEVSSSYTIAAVLVVILVASGLSYRNRAHRQAVLAACVPLGFWFAWSMVSFGTVGSRVPVLNLVASTRAVDMLGYLSMITLCLVLPAVADRPRRGLAVLAAGATALVSAHAGSLLRAQNLPSLPVRGIWLAALVLALIVFAITLRPRWWGGYVGAGLAGLLLVWQVNPVMFGLGDLRGSEVAQKLLVEGADARDRGQVWVSDNFYVDSLLAATGVPALSGRQIAGPDRDAWARLDPSRSSEEAWNRGGSYITFAWTDASTVTISNPAKDLILVSGSPCALAERMPEVSTVVSGHELSSACVTEVDLFMWSGYVKWVYRITPG